MTDEEIDQVVAATLPGNVLTRRWRGFVTRFARTRMGTWAAGKTPRWQTIIAILVLASGYPLVIGSIGATNTHLRESDKHATAQALYVAQLVAYTNAANTYTVCLASASAFAVDRTRWENLAASFEAQYPDSVGIKAVTGLIRAALGPADPLTATDCPVPGTAPIPPPPS